MSGKRTIGLIVNPVAGMGGSVGLKGTDGDMYERARDMGASPVSPARVVEFLRHVTCGAAVAWRAAPGAMGADYRGAGGSTCEEVGATRGRTGPDDTKTIARAMRDGGVELIVFAGGDGTARDMTDAVGVSVPVVAIPSGVKVYSSVFAYSPRAAAGLLDAFVGGADVAEEEVLDIDEDAFRSGEVDVRHYGFLLVPVAEELLQSGKETSSLGASTAEAKRDVAQAVVDLMRPDTLYLLGSGTTVRTLADELGIEKTLLGIDAVLDGELIGVDLNERAILALLDEHPEAVIVVTPLGGNGFIFGRGNKQFSPDVLRRVGRDNIIVVANRDKLLRMSGLHVDTGDADLDATLSGYMDVIVGRGHTKIMRVR